MAKKLKKVDLSSSSSTSSQLHEQKPVAKMKVSVTGKNITKLEVPRVIAFTNPSLVSTIASSTQDDSREKEEKDLAIKSNKKKKKRVKDKLAESRSKEVSESIDNIWEHLSNGNIDLKYATVGYGFNGRPILDHDIFVNLLINYGFTIGPILEFIDDFNAISAEDDDFPMVMVNSHTSTIYSEVKNLDKNESDKSKS